MKCPYCSYEESRVVDSRDTSDGVRRRRECLKCEERFTTYERLQPLMLYVIKKDQRREDFNKQKLLGGIRKACEKRPLATGAVEKLADDIETELYQMGRTEIASSVIGDMVMTHLRKLDNIAYIRFASVYRDFTDITDLKEELDTLLSNQSPPDEQLSLPIKP
jgi:transcriptional repressor NrdR